MNTPNFVKIKDSAVAVAVVTLCVVGFYSTAKLAQESRENRSLREQNKVLADHMKNLDNTFSRIRGYTHSVKALATVDVPTIVADHDINAGGIDFASVKNTIIDSDLRSDAENFALLLNMITDMNNDADRLSRRLESLASILKTRKDLMNNIPSMMPIEGRVASEFGMRLSPFEGKRHSHAGIDIAATVGTKIRAPADGQVTFAGKFETLGNSLVINHGNGVLTRYGHTSKLLVRDGQKIKRGQVIALVGNTGRSTGPHLHYEVWVQNIAVNPRDFFFDIAAKPSTLVKNSQPNFLPSQSMAVLAAMGGDY
jgi:murein DD-endopeptidase MepM/ murein hydrolase activator NlpD